METMTLIKVLSIGMPEIILSILVGLVTCRSNLKKPNYTAFTLKMILSIIVILGTIFLSRSVINSIVIHGIITGVMYVITFLLVWQMNIRQSILATSINMFVVLTLEVFTMPLYQLLLDKWQFDFIGPNFLVILIIRTIHILIFLLFTRINFRDNELLIKKWDRMSFYLKLGVSTIIISMLWCSISMMNYNDMILKLIQTNDVASITNNLTLSFWIIVTFFIFIFLFIYYILRFISIRKILDVTPEELIAQIGEGSSPVERKGYIKILEAIDNNEQ